MEEDTSRRFRTTDNSVIILRILCETKHIWLSCFYNPRIARISIRSQPHFDTIMALSRDEVATRADYNEISTGLTYNPPGTYAKASPQ